MSRLEIVDIEAIACSVPLEPAVTLGLGVAVKREAVIVKVTTGDGITGYGESHHAKAPAAVAALVNTTIRDLVVGMDAQDTTHIWERVYRNQLTSHGAGAAAVCALSGVDIALWDIRAKALGVPLYRLLGGRPDPIPAYAGGISLGFQEPAQLVDEVRACVEAKYGAVKLRVADTPALDIARVTAVREAFGAELDIFVDANTAYTVDDVRKVAPHYRELGVGWLEEPFAPHDTTSYRHVAAWGMVPLAAGENHYTRFEFRDLLATDTIAVAQPDVSKCGGITEFLRICALISAAGLPIAPHTSVTGVSMATSVHVIASVPAARYYEADVAIGNRLRYDLCSEPFRSDGSGHVAPLEVPGIGVEVDEEFLRAHPLTAGSAFVAFDA